MNKRLVVTLAGALVIVLFFVINAVAFSIKEVTVDFDTEASVEQTSDLEQQIIDASGIKPGKNVFAISESKIVKNIETNVPNVSVINIERKFPNKVVIHVSRRIPIYIIPYRQSQTSTPNYVLVDSEMYVLGLTSILSDDYAHVEGYELMGKYSITVGEQLPVDFGDEIYYLQNIVVGFYNEGLTPDGFVSFIKTVRFDDDVHSIDIVTNSGVVIRLGATLTTAEISARIPLAYDWYTAQPDGSENLTKGIALFNGEEFVWNNYE